MAQSADMCVFSQTYAHIMLFIEPKPLATGAHGRVFKGRCEGEDVAIKMSNYPEPQEEAAVLKRLRMLSHPNLVRLVDFDTAIHDPTWIVTELMDCNLFTFLTGTRRKGGALDHEGLRMAMRQLLAGLLCMHVNNMVHGDIKPENLLMRGGELKIADFGHTMILPQRARQYDISTTAYRAPEVWMRDPTYGTPIDLFSAGLVMYDIMWRGTALMSTDNRYEAVCNILGLVGTPESIPRWAEVFGKRRPMPYFLEEDPFIPKFYPPDAAELMRRLLTFDHTERITAEEALGHAFFTPPAPL